MFKATDLEEIGAIERDRKTQKKKKSLEDKAFIIFLKSSSNQGENLQWLQADISSILRINQYKSHAFFSPKKMWLKSVVMNPP